MVYLDKDKINKECGFFIQHEKITMVGRYRGFFLIYLHVGLVSQMTPQTSQENLVWIYQFLLKTFS